MTKKLQRVKCIWEKDIDQYKPKCNNAENIIQLIPKGNLIIVHIIESTLTNIP
ncbi:hypothetical protein ENUP19_0083G0017 [Entamoeba nuttalli]|uniref:Uncharacterized protein n=1 Tax=Entamoeba nuttalli TaxID=412467 RepID=A0ABQ0DFK4_9EUKA